MLKVNFLSDYIKFSKIITVNGAMMAAITQAKIMRNYVKVLINDHGKDFDLIHSHGCHVYTLLLVSKGIKYKKPIVMSAHQTHHDTDISFFFPNRYRS